ncbi:MAG: nucleoside-diphosphate kinase [Nitrospirae bacterium]|nr:nucleoside-diphosphate kinase [Nitrospirota bacterium]
MNREEIEQTLILIKPDALKNSLTGYVLSQLSEFHTGLRFAGAKIVHVNRMLAEEHYAEHRGKPFYPSLIEYIMGMIHYPDDPGRRRVIALVYQGGDAVNKIRDICGPTNPHVARERRPGCIRALGTVVPLKDAAGNDIGERMDNLIHASATLGEAEREIKLWFRPADFPPFMRSFPTEMNEDDHYYFRGGRLSTEHEPGGVCLVAPGDVLWKSDADALRSLRRGEPAPASLGAVAAKYLINYEAER